MKRIICLHYLSILVGLKNIEIQIQFWGYPIRQNIHMQLYDCNFHEVINLFFGPKVSTSNQVTCYRSPFSFVSFWNLYTAQVFTLQNINWLGKRSVQRMLLVHAKYLVHYEKHLPRIDKNSFVCSILIENLIIKIIAFRTGALYMLVSYSLRSNSF
ncbi:hypothetical protein ACJX0J_020772 [Zea mays]